MHDRRGAVAVMMAMLAVPMLGAVALATDVSVWYLEQHRLQIAADAAAHAGAMQLGNTTLQTGLPAAFGTLVANEAQAVTGGSLVGTMGTPVVSVASGYTSITVTLTSKADTFFANALYSTAVTLSATAIAGVTASPCVLALSPTADQALTVDGSGKITASGCSVFSNSSSASAIYANGSGSINAKSVGAAGGYTQSNAGSVTPAPSSGQSVQSDPGSSYTLPSAGSCTFNNVNYTSSNNGLPYALSPGTYCGTTTIGGNGSTDVLAPGVYVFTGNVTFDNANITQGSGVTFIMLGVTNGASAGTFTWKNNSTASLSAPTAGAYAGLLFWQACPNGKTSGSNTNGQVLFNGGSALAASGLVYAPCGPFRIDNGVQLTAPANGSLGVAAATVVVAGGAVLKPASTAGNTSEKVSMLQ